MHRARTSRSFVVIALVAALGLSAQTQKKEPAIPIGLDAYRQWDRWPEQRIGMRTYMLSTYDRSGANEGADASHFLYQLSDNFNVSMDIEGAGMLVFARFNHWHGSPWHFVVDGRDHIVQESSTHDSLYPLPDSTFLPQSAFPAPLNETWATTKGADLVWSPVPFERSFQMAYSRTHYGTGYYIVDRFVPGIALSHPLRSWTEQTAPNPDVLNLIRQAGSDIAPEKGLTERHGAVDVPASGAATVAELHGKAEVRTLSFTISREQALAFSRVHLRVTWDGRAEPSIDAPVALFYGAGILYNRDNREYLVKAFPVSIRYSANKVSLACYFPMPFFRSARIELVGDGQPFHDVTWQVRYEPLRTPLERSSYFHATYRDVPRPVAGEDLTLLDTRQEEGGGNWSGNFVGTSFIFSYDAQLTTLEGDPRFFFDDSLTPQAQGTGTEEWGGGGDYWGGSNMTLAFAGHPVGARDAKTAVNEDDKIESAYRFLLGDLFPFGRNAVIRLEHGGTDESTEHYETVAFWYGLPSASLIKTDELQIGDAAAEQAHGYQSPEASEPYSITSRYEWGVDTLDGQSVYPPQEDRGRVTTGTSEFRMQLNSDNQGVLLRRKLDYKFANQRAEVSIEDEATRKWTSAGIWYLAGSNTCVYSNPKGELGATEHIVQTSNRRFRDDEFLISRKLTAGRRSIRIRIRYTPVNRPLYPGYPPGDQGWSEIKYTAYSFVVPGKTW